VHDLCTETTWRRRYRHIAAFRQMLVDEGTTIRKFFLHISKDEQRQRLQERIDDPKKRWKWSSRDLDERARWDDYQQAYEDALAATSTHDAPWYVVPADRNWYRDLAVSGRAGDRGAAGDVRAAAARRQPPRGRHPRALGAAGG
jgi:polyphosphate kinase 2 (PPK2 family)